MNKRVLVSIAILIVTTFVLGAALTGCAPAAVEPTPTDESVPAEIVDTANSWSEAKSSKEAAEGAGIEFFELVDPLGLGDELERSYRYTDCIAEIQVDFGASAITIRKGTAAVDGDISGDDNEYALTWTQNIKGLNVTCFGNRENAAIKTIWSVDDMYYSIVAQGLGGDVDYGLTADGVHSVVMGLQ